MSQWTMEIRTMCEAYLGLDRHVEFDQIDSAITQAIPSVFNFTWPIFDESYRIPLESKILKWFWTREIGTETVGEFKLYLSNKLNRIMPYYNQLYESALIKFDPLNDVGYQRTYKRTENETANEKGTTNRTSDADGTLDSTVDNNNTVTRDLTTKDSGNVVESDTPQGFIQDVLDKKYASRVSQNENTNTQTGTISEDGSQNRHDSSTTIVKDDETRNRDNTRNTTDDYVESIVGKMGGKSYSTMINQFRETFLNIDSMILDELEELFFGLW